MNPIPDEPTLYRIEYRPSAAKQLRKLPRDIQLRIAPAVESLRIDPRPIGSETVRGLDSARRIRIGDYRVVYEIVDDLLIVSVVRIGHRRDVYRDI